MLDVEAWLAPVRERALENNWHLDVSSEREKADFVDGQVQIRIFEHHIILDYTKKWGE